MKPLEFPFASMKMGAGGIKGHNGHACQGTTNVTHGQLLHKKDFLVAMGL
jgi:hypothetical protein